MADDWTHMTDLTLKNVVARCYREFLSDLRENQDAHLSVPQAAKNVVFIDAHTLAEILVESPDEDPSKLMQRIDVILRTSHEYHELTGLSPKLGQDDMEQLVVHLRSEVHA